MSGLCVRAVLAERHLDVELEVGEGEVVALIGANGSGKSTLLSVVAGLLAPDEGHVRLGDDVLVDTGRGIRVPPHQRGVVLLAQQALLFPHLTAAQNVAFGPRAQGLSRAVATERAARWLAEVHAAALADRRPDELSGGQAQRIAVARALAAEPRLLLLDEPMEALDVAAAPALRQLLRAVLRETDAHGRRRSALLVTHDVLDALVLADRVVVLEQGHVVEQGPTREVFARPRSAFAARLAGLNLVAGTVQGDGVRDDGGRVVVGVLTSGCEQGEAGVAVFRPGSVAVHAERPRGSPRTVLEVEVASVEPRGELVRVRSVEVGRGAGLIADLTPVSAAELDLVAGARVYFAVKAAEVAVHPARAGCT